MRKSLAYLGRVTFILCLLALCLFTSSCIRRFEKEKSPIKITREESLIDQSGDIYWVIADSIIYSDCSKIIIAIGEKDTEQIKCMWIQGYFVLLIVGKERIAYTKSQISEGTAVLLSDSIKSITAFNDSTVKIVEVVEVFPH